MSSLLYVSCAKETYNLKEPASRSHPIHVYTYILRGHVYTYILAYMLHVCTYILCRHVYIYMCYVGIYVTFIYIYIT